MSSHSGNREIDPLVGNFSHQKHRPREAEALGTLKKIASLVKPLMRVRGWKVGTLSEFYPEEQNLLGLNKNRGQAIYLRLRYPGDANQFMPLEAVVDTMLHELSHNVWGEHDERFHALWDELRKEYEGLISSGYTGAGFLSKGQVLGGRRMPRDEAQRIRRVAAEKRAALSRGSGQKLGGAAVPIGADIREVIADAVERRSTITKGCGSGGNKNIREIEAISDQANKSSSRTTAEEDEANDAAIAQALWELHQEDEKERYGNAYVPPSQTSFSAKDSGMKNSSSARPIPKPASISPTRFDFKHTDSATRSSSQSAKPPHNRNVAGMSRLVPSLPTKKRGRSASPTKSYPDPVIIGKTSASAPAPKFWTCPACTFAGNALLHLCCDMCLAEQPKSVMLSSARPTAEKKVSSKPGSLGIGSHTWVCHCCSNVMQNQWWTCSVCGTVKLSSKA